MDNPANPNLTQALKAAQTFFREGQWDKALGEYEKLLNSDRNNPEFLAAVADTYAKKRSTQLAFEFYYKAIPYFLVQNRFDDAILCYQKITRLDLAKLSSDVRMDMNIYKRYVEIDDAVRDKRYESAIAPLAKLAKLRPQDPMIAALLKSIGAQIDKITPSAQRYQTLGETFMRNDFPEKAWDMYRKAAEIDPQFLLTLTSMAENFVKQGQNNEAKKAYLYLAEQALNRADVNKTLEYAKKAVELKSLEAGYILGVAYFQKKNWQEAKTEFEKLLRIKVNHLGALTYLARTLGYLSQQDKANELFQKAFKIDENNPLVQEAWIQFCLQGPDKEAAIPQLAFLLEKVVTEHNAQKIAEYSAMMIQIRPDLISARTKLIQALQMLGDNQGAADACRALAMIYEQQGLLNESTEYLEKAKQLDPNYKEEVKEATPVVEDEPQFNVPSIPEIPVVEEPIAFVEEEVPEPPVIHYTPPVEPERPNPTPQPAVAAQAPPPTTPKPQPATPMQPTQPISAQPGAPDDVSSLMATAQLCLTQGLYKAAIDIYQQILATNPKLTQVHQKLAEANTLYLKKFVEKGR